MAPTENRDARPKGSFDEGLREAGENCKSRRLLNLRGAQSTRTGAFWQDETMEDTLAKIRKFRDERDWLQFHDPKNLAASISVEAAELLELFQWRNGEESLRYAKENKERVSEEVADVAIYLIELADVVGIDLLKAIDDKLAKNAVKYPVEKSRGRITKYTDLK